MSTRTRFVCVLLLLLVAFTVLGCGSGSQNTDTVTVPEQDRTSPTSTMDFFFSDTLPTPPLTVKSTSGPVTHKIPSNSSSITAIARGDDPEGLRTIQIWATYTTTTCHDSTCTQSGPGLAGSPEKENLDENAKPGAVAMKSRLVAFDIDVPQLLKGHNTLSIDVWAQAINAHGQSVQTAVATLKWPYPGQHIPWAVLLCQFNDKSQQPQSLQFYQQFLTEAGAGKGGMFDYWRDTSYDTLDISGSTVYDGIQHDWFKMSHPYQWTSNRRLIIQDCIDAAANSVNFTPYFGIIAIVNGGTNTGAVTNVTLNLNGTSKHYGLVLLDPAALNVSFTAQEMGHNYNDLPHSYAINLNPGQPDIEYGDQWDIMSGYGGANGNIWSNRGTTPFGTIGCPIAAGCLGPELNAPYRDRLGWIPANARYTFSGQSPSTLTIAALNHPEESLYRIAIVPIGSDPKHYYTVEFRAKTGWDSGIPQNTILIHEVRPNGISYLVPVGGGYSALPGATFQDTTDNVRISVIAFDNVSFTATVTIGPDH